MTKILGLVVALGGIGACTNDGPTTPLSQLGQTQLELVANGQINAELKLIGHTDCPTLQADVVATFNGHPMEVSAGGYDTTGDGCYPISFWIKPTEIGGIVAREAGAGSSEIIVEDSSAHWVIGSTNVFANRFSVDTANNQIVWSDVSAITTAKLTPYAPVTIEGNVIHYPAGTVVDSVSAYAHPTPSTCDGPGLCVVDLTGNRAFNNISPK